MDGWEQEEVGGEEAAVISNWTGAGTPGEKREWLPSYRQPGPRHAPVASCSCSGLLEPIGRHLGSLPPQLLPPSPPSSGRPLLSTLGYFFPSAVPRCSCSTWPFVRNEGNCNRIKPLPLPCSRSLALHLPCPPCDDEWEPVKKRQKPPVSEGRETPMKEEGHQRKNQRSMGHDRNQSRNRTTSFWTTTLGVLLSKKKPEEELFRCFIDPFLLSFIRLLLFFFSLSLIRLTQ